MRPEASRRWAPFTVIQGLEQWNPRSSLLVAEVDVNARLCCRENSCRERNRTRCTWKLGNKENSDYSLDRPQTEVRVSTWLEWEWFILSGAKKGRQFGWNVEVSRGERGQVNFCSEFFSEGRGGLETQVGLRRRRKWGVESTEKPYKTFIRLGVFFCTIQRPKAPSIAYHPHLVRQHINKTSDRHSSHFLRQSLKLEISHLVRVCPLPIRWFRSPQHSNSGMSILDQAVLERSRLGINYHIAS